MTNKTITFSLTGEESVIDAGLENYSKSQGWKANILQNGELIANPVSFKDFAKIAFGKYFNRTVSDYASAQAKAQALKGTQEAMETVTIAISE
ncbi:MAG: hypothetical protein ACRC5T_11145 [Cetobacterium sp.]